MFVRTGLFLVTMTLAGCATVTPSSTILASLHSSGEAVALGNVDLTKRVMLSPNSDGLKSEIDSSDGLVQVDGYQTYYKIFEVSPTSAMLKFEVDSYCQCLGSDKRMMVPTIHFLDGKMKVIEPSKSHYSTSGIRAFGPMYLYEKADVSGENIKYIVIAADNAQPDVVVQNIIYGNYGSSDIRNYPFGKFKLMYHSM